MHSKWLRPIAKAGPQPMMEKKVDERTKPTTATQKEEQIKSLVFQPNSVFLVCYSLFPSGKSSWPGFVVG